MQDKVLDQIRKLLALGRRSPNPAESDTALAAARRLMLKHQLTEADVDRSVDWCEAVFWAGRKRPVWSEHCTHLVSEFFFCRFLVKSTIDEALLRLTYELVGLGRPENVAVGTYAFNFLSAEFAHRLRQAKPRSQRTYCAGIYLAVQTKLAADERGWGSRAETAELIVSPRRLHVEVEAEFDRRYADIPTKAAPRKLQGTVSDLRRGLEDGKSIDLRRPLASSQAAGIRGLPAPVR